MIVAYSLILPLPPQKFKSTKIAKASRKNTPRKAKFYSKLEINRHKRGQKNTIIQTQVVHENKSSKQK